MRIAKRLRLAAIASSATLLSSLPPMALAADSAPAPAAVTAAAAANNRVPGDRATFFANADLQEIWKDLEARQVINQRIVEGGSYSVNVRIVKPNDAPLVHQTSFDLWVVTAGSATAITGGELLNPVKRPVPDDTAGSAIRGGTDRAIKQGDIVFIPPGVPHGFKDLKDFRAFLIRFEARPSAGQP